MKNAIILHGQPSKEAYYSTLSNADSNSNVNWVPWLQQQLIAKDIFAHAPEIPFSFEPKYEIWKKEIERYDVNENTILVGHSAGAGFFTRWLSENKAIKIYKLILVAPYFDPFREIKEDFYNFEFDRNLSTRVKNNIVVFHSDNDMEDVQISTKKLLDEVDNIIYQEFHGYGHFCEGWDMSSREFPELLEECITK